MDESFNSFCMKNLLSIGLTGLIAWAFSYFLPWWGFAIPVAVMGFLAKNGRDAFGKGSAAITLLWTALAIFHNSLNGGLLAGKMGQLLGGLNAWQLIAITAALGGLLGGLSGLTGHLARKAFGGNAW